MKRQDERIRTYDAYGRRATSVVAARAGLAGMVGEAWLPWYLLGARFYVPALRRFIAPDVASPFEAGGLNRYAYCAGDPINRIDPTGRAWWDWLGAALGIVGAIAGTVLTGGALLGVLGAAAAGSLTAAVSTGSMVTMTAAAVLDVTSIAVEVGSIASMAAGDLTASGIFGWMALGMGLASLGTAGMARAGKGAGRNLIGRRERPRAGFVTGPLKDKPLQGYSRVTHTSADGLRRIKVYVGEGAVQKKIPQRAQRDTGGRITGIDLSWKEVTNAGGGINYLADTEVIDTQLLPLMRRIAAKDDSLPVTVLSGVHGSPEGDNWFMQRRTRVDWDLFDVDNDNASVLAFHAGRPDDLEVRDMGLMETSEIEQIVQSSAAHIVHAYCYGAADRQVMEWLNIPFSRSFRL